MKALKKLTKKLRVMLDHIDVLGPGVLRDIVKAKTGFWWHSQNLNDRHGLNGSMWINGRAWLQHTSYFSIGQEWSLKHRSGGIGVKVDSGENQIMFHVCIPPVALFTTFTLPYKYNKHLNLLLTGAYERDTYISFHDWSVWVNLWRDDSSWSNHKTFWEQRCASLNFLDLVFGRWKYTERTVEERDVKIPMPEGNYPAKVRIFESTWKRPRWFPQKMIRANVDIKDNKSIPFPGKGENSWDCGMDGLHGMTCSEKTVEDAIGAVVGSVLHSRRRHGGIGWNPEPGDIPPIVEPHFPARTEGRA